MQKLDNPKNDFFKQRELYFYHISQKNMTKAKELLDSFTTENMQIINLHLDYYFRIKDVSRFNNYFEKIIKDKPQIGVLLHAKEKKALITSDFKTAAKYLEELIEFYMLNNKTIPTQISNRLISHYYQAEMYQIALEYWEKQLSSNNHFQFPQVYIYQIIAKQTDEQISIWIDRLLSIFIQNKENQSLGHLLKNLIMQIGISSIELLNSKLSLETLQELNLPEKMYNFFHPEDKVYSDDKTLTPQRRLICSLVEKSKNDSIELAKKFDLYTKYKFFIEHTPSKEMFKRPLISIKELRGFNDIIFSPKVSNSNKVVIVFSGIMGEVSDKPLELIDHFFAASGVNTIYCRDLNRTLFLNGIQSQNSLEDTIKFIKKNVLEIYGLKNPVYYTFSTSAGGMAAFMYGHLLKANSCIAFSPLFSIAESDKDTRGRLVRRRVSKLISREKLNVESFIGEKPLFKEAKIFYGLEN
ncbi:MAG TPA: hypothetical protein ENK66_10650, partial [Arcobacter sp.]|nr:hypothetical protein [Arcobacter sp.]